MKFALIGCSVLCRDISYSIATSKNTIIPFWLKQGLHNTPTKLTEEIRKTIQEIEDLNEEFEVGTANENKRFDAILLGYGLCANSILGLSPVSLPIIIPKCDDCMAIFLGSQEKYLDYFNSNKGIYWYNKGWVESGAMPSKEKYDKLYEKYCEEYDEDTAEYLIEEETSYIPKYENSFFIKSDIYDDFEEREFTKKSAKDFGWKYQEVPSGKELINDLLSGNWDNRFLVCEKGYKVVADYTGEKIKSEKI